jgi:exo-beta-1,3-glucanase (GH17 family)
MKMRLKILLILSLVFLMFGCFQENKKRKDIDITAADILGNPEYLAFSYGGYRENTREVVPTIEELKDDMKILSAMGIKLIRTYNTQQFGHAANLLEAISQLKDEDPNFEMYVMLGTWIECEGAWSVSANHKAGNIENNTAEIEAAVKMAQTYPDIVKIIAVGNEAMVQWAINYFVYPNVILKWVDYLKELRDRGEIPSSVWLTSSDNYESWGGGANSYQTDELAALVKAVDFISLHTYPFHDSHYNPTFWGVPEEEEDLPKLQQIEAAMLRAKNYAISQYQSAVDYVTSLGIDKPVHIGETGWATIASSSYGAKGSRAADEYKEKLYYEHMRDWTNSTQMSCFYFEAFDEQWKDQGNPLGSENHFGLINLKGEAKFPLWDIVDNGVLDGLTRNGIPITKTYDGDISKLMEDVLAPPLRSEMGLLEIATMNKDREIGQIVDESTYVVVHETLVPEGANDISYPSEKLKLNAWEGTCGIEMSQDGIIEVKTGTGAWWGCALEIVGGTGENLSNFELGQLNFEIKGNTLSSFQIGFQTGLFAEGTQTNNQVIFNPESNYSITNEWKSYSIPLAEIDQGANLSDVTALLFFRGDKDFDGKDIYIKNIYYSTE